jgi:subtilisin family serine protease
MLKMLIAAAALAAELLSIGAAQAEDRRLLSADAWIVTASDPSAFPDALVDQVRAVGGQVTAVMPEIGMALASSADPGFATAAAAIPGIASVVPDLPLMPADGVAGAVETSGGSSPPAGDYTPLQWALDALDAPEAWALGARGAGVRVVVLDWGTDTDHVDLAPNLNLALSRCLVPGESLDYDLDLVPNPATPFAHGAMVSGIIAAADNGVGTTGVAPEAELIHLKVGLDRTGGAAGGMVIYGIYQAANLGADVINMSMAGFFSRSGWYLGNPNNPNDDLYIGAKEAAETLRNWTWALQYAHQKGATIIAAAGNDALNRDQTNDMVVTPGDLPYVIQVSATGPQGWWTNPDTDLDLPAPYSNYGLSAIDVAGPAGLLGRPYFWRMSDEPAPDWAYDLALSPDYDGGYVWVAGTSSAAPHVAGVAALIIGANGGDMHPDQVRAILMGTADDLGKPGKDEHYGHGRVNALRAVLQK